MSALPEACQPPRAVPDLDRVLAIACAEAGFPARARLLRHFANAVYLLDGVPVVARVGYGPDAAGKAATAVAVTRWLAKQRFPVTEPVTLPSGAEQPIVVAGHGRDVAVSFWRYYPQPDDGWPNTTTLGRIARHLHDLPAPPVTLADYRPLRSLHAALTDARHDSTGRDWLLGRVADLREAYSELDFPLGRGFIHGDVYTGNLLWVTAGGETAVVLGDWDSVCVGPRELDLIPTYHEPRFGVDPATVNAFAAAYGHDLRDWHGYRTLYDIRELSTLTALVRLAPTSPASARELAHRLDSLKNRRHTVTWHGQ